MPELVYFEGSPGNASLNRIVLIRADGTGRRVLWEEAPGNFGYELPQFNPRGDTLLFLRQPDGGQEWWLVPVGGGQPQSLPLPTGAGFPKWSPNGDLLAWIVFNGARAHLGVAPPGTTVLTPITPDTMIQAGGYDWSPSGAQLVVALALEGDLQTDLYLAAPGGGDLVPLTQFANSTEYRPAWSPDGSRIAYLRVDLNEGNPDWGLWVIRPNGTDNRRLLPNPLIGEVIGWTPDSRELLVARDNGLTGGERGFVDVETGAFRRLTVTGRLVRDNPISPDGEFVLVDGRTTLNREAVEVAGLGDGRQEQMHPDSLMGIRPVWRP